MNVRGTRSLLLLGFLFWMPLALLGACGGGGVGGSGVDTTTGAGGGTGELPALPQPTNTGTDPATISQTPPYGTEFTSFPHTSGVLVNEGDEPKLTDPYVLSVPDAITLRVIFEEVRLSPGTVMEVRSPLTGEAQYFSAEEAQRWGNTTGHFLGDSLEIRVLLAPHSSASYTIFGVFEGVVPRDFHPSQCGGTDDRVPSADPRSGRLNGNCTMWIEGGNNCAFSAGHCFSGMASPQTFPHIIEFNVPLSNADGSLNPAPIRDQYPITAGTLTFVDNPANSADRPDDWAVARLGLNNLGETAVSRQGNGFLIDTGQVFPVFPLGGDPITITGYGVELPGGQPTRNQVQQTDTGPWVGWTGQVASYQVDTEGANSGSPVFSNFDARVIAIHTNAGCFDGGGGVDAGSNSGSGITHPPIVAAHTTVCGKAAPVITGPGNQVLECNGPGGATVTLPYPTSDPDAQLVLVDFRVDGTIQGSDSVAGAGVAQFTFTFPLGGPYTVVATATNAGGTQASVTITVTAQDTTPPVIVCPANVVFDCNGTNVVTYPDPTATDNCGTPTLVCNPPSGSVFPIGVTVVNCSATDGSGNVGNCSFSVTVQDVTPPTLTMNVARTLLWLPMNGMADVGLTATATDACDPDVDLTLTVFSDENHGVAPLAPDALLLGVAPNQRLQLRAQRDAIINNGRWYIVVIDAEDDVGNWTRDHRVVVVPYNLTTSQILAIRALANAQVGFIPSPAFGGPPNPGPTTPPGSFLLLSASFN